MIQLQIILQIVFWVNSYWFSYGPTTGITFLLPLSASHLSFVVKISTLTISGD